MWQRFFVVLAMTFLIALCLCAAVASAFYFESLLTKVLGTLCGVVAALVLLQSIRHVLGIPIIPFMLVTTGIALVLMSPIVQTHSIGALLGALGKALVAYLPIAGEALQAASRFIGAGRPTETDFFLCGFGLMFVLGGAITSISLSKAEAAKLMAEAEKEKAEAEKNRLTVWGSDVEGRTWAVSGPQKVLEVSARKMIGKLTE